VNVGIFNPTLDSDGTIARRLMKGSVIPSVARDLLE